MTGRRRFDWRSGAALTSDSGGALVVTDDRLYILVDDDYYNGTMTDPGELEQLGRALLELAERLKGGG